MNYVEKSGRLNFPNKQTDLTPYTPSNGNEEKWFYDNWCSQCKSTQHQECSVLIQMYAIGEQPSCIYFLNNVPVCDRYQDVEE